MIYMDYEIKYVMDHVEVFKDDDFLFSADTASEAINDIRSMIESEDKDMETD